MTLKAVAAFRKIEQKYEQIAELQEIVNTALEAKYGDVQVQHNWSDGMVIMFDDNENASINSDEIKALLDKRVSVEEGMSYLREKSI